MTTSPFVAPTPIRRRRAIGLAALAGVGTLVQSRAADPLHPSIGQLAVAVGDGWDATRGSFFLYSRENSGAPWRLQTPKPVPVLFGRSGLAWGRGYRTAPQPGEPVKREGDRRAPTGIFQIGKVFGYAGTLPDGANPRYPYRQVGPWDCWIDDPEHPQYNQHVVLDPSNGVPDWFEKGKMRHGDFAYEWLVEIRHNADRPVPGAGSAIFFHIRRGPDRPSHGCTTMAKSQLEDFIRWLRPDTNPHYVILPSSEYARLQNPWGLPALPSA